MTILELKDQVMEILSDGGYKPTSLFVTVEVHEFTGAAAPDVTVEYVAHAVGEDCGPSIKEYSPGGLLKAVQKRFQCYPEPHGQDIEI